MADHVKVIAPRAPTPVPGTRGPTTGRLPDELLSEQVRRLALFSAVGAGLWAFGLAMDLLLVPLTVPMAVHMPMAWAIEASGIAAGVLMFLYARYAPHAPQTKSDVALGYMLVNAAGIALLNTWVTTPMAMGGMHLSWNTILILVFSMILPTCPRKMLVTSLAAASADPLGVWVAHLRGVDVPSVGQTLVFFLPNYVCAVVATLPSHLFQRLGRRLREAQELGSYQLIEQLGAGGMGEVWRAEHRLLARSAAIKLVRPEVLGAGAGAAARVALRRFEREAQATAALSSPHTIRLYDFGVTDEGVFYYVMELLQGLDLETLVNEFGPVPADRAIFLLRQVCHSLADAHARGLVHRDVKPANIYVCRMGLEYDFVKVLDFGLVKFKDQADTDRTMLTKVDSTSGTPAYMAPEVILGEADVDRRADVYALGCVAYHLLTGQLVFEADTPMKMLLQHVQASPVPPSKRTELKIPRELEELVLACLEKDPDKRPQNAEQLFEMACRCRTCDTWDQELARLWWQTNLPQFTGPLTLTAPAPGRAAAVFIP